MINLKLSNTHLFPNNTFLCFVLLSFGAISAGCGGAKKNTLPELEVPTPVVEERVDPAPEPVRATPEPRTPDTTPKIAFNLQRIHFDFDQYDLTGVALNQLAENARVLRAYPTANILIEGHCDERGTVEYNLALGDKRARAAKDYLLSLGISASRISTISYGKERPIDYGHNESAWSQNRRAEFLRR